MNTIRVIAIALPVVLLMACGGGGGGTAAVTPTTPAPMTMMPPGTDDPMNPGTNDPNTPPTNMPPTVVLPGYVITDLPRARTRVGSNAPTSMTETQIVSTIQTRATAADTFEFSDFSGTPSVDITCSNTNKTCSGSVPDADTLTFSLAGIDDLSLVDDTGLVGFDSNTQAVMMEHGVTMIQSEAAAGQNDGTHLTFQSYGGWLTDSVFGVEILGVTENGATTNRFASFSFGKASGSNPAATAVWDGSLSGTNTNGHFIHGDAEIAYNRTSGNISVGFTNIYNLNTNNQINSFNWSGIPLNNGVFRSNDNTIQGNIYGTNHREIGGIFNQNGIIGAFGGRVQ